MDDLAGLDWAASSDAKKASNYNFDALLRSMPAAGGERAAPPPAQGVSAPPRAPPTTQARASARGPASGAPAAGEDDAFASLLSFGSDTAASQASRGAAAQPSAMSRGSPQKAAAPPAPSAAPRAAPVPASAASRNTRAAPMSAAAASAARSTPIQAASVSASSSAKPRAPPSASHDAWGWDAFESWSTPPQTAPPSPPASELDDMLGALGAPAPPRPTPPPAPSAPRRGATPPPHILGALVLEGYAPDDARKALAQTASGHDVDQARALLQQWHPPPPPPPPADKAPADAPGRAPAPDERDARARRHQRPAEAPAAHPERGLDDASALGLPPHLQRHADQLYTQASVLGRHVLKNAHALWGTAKAQAQKAVEDAREDPTLATHVNSARELTRHALRRWGGAGASAARPVDFQARPKWMSESPQAASSDASPPASEGAPAPSAEPPAASAREVSLLGDDDRMVAAASARTAPAARAPATPAATPPAAKPRAAAPPWAAAAPPAAPLPRDMPAEDASSVTRAATLKDHGNDCFRRGAYAEAEAHYTKALELLAPRSLWRVPLLNNRANVRLRNGSSEGALADCTSSIELIVLPGMHGGLYRPRQDLLPPTHAELKLREAYAKSLSQRARAHEAMEKWQRAHDDWHALQQYEKAEGSGAHSGDAYRRSAQEGMARCAQMLHPPAPKPPPPRAARPAAAVATEGDAVKRMRAIHDAQATEEAQRLAVKDRVDARLLAWKQGKETNVRALLASVDDPAYQLLWPELHWKKVGLHELLTDAQVKKAYTRAISKLHPDKLPPSKASVEQRMLAAGVFHTLNDAFAGSS